MTAAGAHSTPMSEPERLAAPSPPPDAPADTTAAPDAGRRQISVTTLTVTGFGALIALAVGLVLWLGLDSATGYARAFLQERSHRVLDTLEHHLDERLDPISSQADWIVQQIIEGTLPLEDEAYLDAFMLGALAATPQVAGVAIFRPDGVGREWYRGLGIAVHNDRSDEEDLLAWLRQGASAPASAWRDPFWLNTLETGVVLHDSPLRRDGRFVGMLGQVVPLGELSEDLIEHAPEFTTPFVLHRNGTVLAHPSLAGTTRTFPLPSETAPARQPLPTIAELGDPVLSGLGTSQNREGRWLLRDESGLKVDWVVLDDVWHLVLRREIAHYGDWVVGVHIDVAQLDDEALFHVAQAGGAGLAVLVLAVLIAILLGRRISRPVRAVARAARAVENDQLDDAPHLPASAIREMDEANRSFNRMIDGLRERELIRHTLGRYVPEEVARTLLSAGGRLEPEQAEASVLFCDLKGFTSLTETLGPERMVEVLNEWFSRMTGIIEAHDGTVIQFQGDALLAAFNVPIRNPRHAENALRAALAMREATHQETFGGEQLGCRTGVGTGEVTAGAVGAAGRLSYTVYGDAVNLAARLEGLNREHDTTLLLGERTATAAGLEVDDDGAASTSAPHLVSVATTIVRGQSTPTRLFTISPGVLWPPA